MTGVGGSPRSPAEAIRDSSPRSGFVPPRQREVPANFGFGGSWDIGAGVTLDVGFGLNQFDEDTGYEDYNDYSVSVNRDFGPVNAAIGFYGTDADGEFNFGETADNRFVLTLSIGG